MKTLLFVMLISLMLISQAQQPAFGQTQKEDTARFAQLIGNQAKADALYAELSKLANDTGLEMSAVCDAATRLLNLRAKPEVIGTMIELAADTAVGVHSNEIKQRTAFFTMVESLAKLATLREGDSPLRELYALDFAGIPAFSLLAARLGVTETDVKDYAARRGITGGDCIDAIVPDCFRKYHGLAKKLAASRKQK